MIIFIRRHLPFSKIYPFIRKGYCEGCSATSKPSKTRRQKKSKKGESLKDEEPLASATEKRNEGQNTNPECLRCDGENTVHGYESVRSLGNNTEKQEENSLLEGYIRKSYNVMPDSFFLHNIESFPLHVNRNDIPADNSQLEFSYVPSVSTILSATRSEESKRRLEKWKTEMIDKKGESEFNKVEQDPVKCKKKKRFKSKDDNKESIRCTVVETLDRGRKFHRGICSYLRDKDRPEECFEGVEKLFNSVKNVLEQISNPVILEQLIGHPYLYYRGIVDCVASYNNIPHLIEWKQSNKKKDHLEHTYETPLQVCAYLGMLSCNKIPGLEAPVTNALVVLAHTDGSPAKVFPMDHDLCQHYWEVWLRRIQQFWIFRLNNENPQ